MPRRTGSCTDFRWIAGVSIRTPLRRSSPGHARRNLNVTCIETFTAERRGDMWNDFVAVFGRGRLGPRAEAAFLYAHFPARNVSRFDRDNILRPTAATEDARLLAAALRALLTLEARAAELAAPDPGGGMADATTMPPDIRSRPHVRRIKRLLGGAIEAELTDFGAPGAEGRPARAVRCNLSSDIECTGQARVGRSNMLTTRLKVKNLNVLLERSHPKCR